MSRSNALPVVSLSIVMLAALAVGGCSGAKDTDLDDNLEVSEVNSSSAALEGPASPAAPTSDAHRPGKGKHDGDRGDRGDRAPDKGDQDDVGGCHDDDREGHRGHHHHLFAVLDRLDGTRDKTITIAALPDLPPLLIAALHALDANGDGLVTKDEARASRHGEPDPAPTPVIN